MTVVEHGEPRPDPAEYVEQESGFHRRPDTNSPVALFVSPHLDDVAFSCGGALALFAERGWYTVLVTVFTRSIPEPIGFALACQTDKGIAPGTDYMALRREEDREFAARSGVGGVAWLGLPEAPHRGYSSAEALFSGIREGDEIWRDVADCLTSLLEVWKPKVVVVPQALGNHADHLQVVRAVDAILGPRNEVVWYRDTPYAAREPVAKPSPLLPNGLAEEALDVAETLHTKLHACAAYATQLGFQFGGEEAMQRTLADFAATEARRLGSPARFAEALLMPKAPGQPGVARLLRAGCPV